MEELFRENEHLGLMVNYLCDELYEVRTSAGLKEGALHRAQEECDAHHAATKQKAKEAEQLRTVLWSKEEELQRECAVLG
jgi:hypothetical protein